MLCECCNEKDSVVTLTLATSEGEVKDQLRLCEECASHLHIKLKIVNKNRIDIVD